MSPQEEAPFASCKLHLAGGGCPQVSGQAHVAGADQLSFDRLSLSAFCSLREQRGTPRPSGWYQLDALDRMALMAYPCGIAARIHGRAIVVSPVFVLRNELVLKGIWHRKRCRCFQQEGRESLPEQVAGLFCTWRDLLMELPFC